MECLYGYFVCAVQGTVNVILLEFGQSVCYWGRVGFFVC
jgi:hypothetical protein